MNYVESMQDDGHGGVHEQGEAAMMAQNLRRSSVFIIRTWTEARGEHLAELRGMVREVQSGETRYFRTWEGLLAFVERHHEAQEMRDDQPDEWNLIT